MISLTTTAHVVHAMSRARHIELCAYLLQSKRILRAAETSAAHGADVTVRVEARPYADSEGKLAKINRASVAELRAAGVDARLIDRSGRRAMHLKAAIVDGVVFLDDRNWPSDPRNSVVADDDARDVQAVHAAMLGNAAPTAAVALTKAAALAQEAAVLSKARNARVIRVESESFSAGSAPYTALRSLARAGPRVELLVARRDLKPSTANALRALARSGVAVRVTSASEKFAVTDGSGWIGSANATYGRGDQIDWGVRVEDRALRTALSARFDATWKRASRFDAA